MSSQPSDGSSAASGRGSPAGTMLSPPPAPAVESGSGDRPSAASTHRRVWDARAYGGLLWRWSRRDFIARYHQSALRTLWAFLQPVAFVAVYAAFFGGILKVDGDDLPYLSFFVAGMVAYRFMASGLSNASGLVDTVNLTSRIYFPREIIPLSQAVIGLIDLAVGLGALVLVGSYQGNRPTITAVASPLPILVAILFTTAFVVFLSTVTVFLRDVQFALPLVLQGLFFASPIAYPPDQVPGWLQWLTVVNPLAVAAEGLRDTILRGSWPDYSLLLIHVVVGCGLLALAIAHLRAVEHRIVDLA